MMLHSIGLQQLNVHVSNIFYLQNKNKIKHFLQLFVVLRRIDLLVDSMHHSSI